MAILINIPNRKLDKLIEKLSQSIPLQEIFVWPEVPEPEEVEFALVWKHQHGSLADLPNLKAINSFGAGVDSILSDPELPNVPIARIVDPDLAVNMANYVIGHILEHKLRSEQFRLQQSQQLWKPKSPRKGNRVGILGAGQLGSFCAQQIQSLGFKVSVWSQSEKQLPGITSRVGEDGLQQMAAEVDYLICLLPLTKSTKAILNQELFERMKPESVLFNVARGEHLVEHDLIDALNEGHMDHAVLDVFSQEPLPSTHEFWTHEKITITPHVSAVTNVDTAVDQVIKNYQRIQQGKSIINAIDLAKGY